MTSVHVGSTLGKYELTSELGQGGMSVVYRARDTQLKRDVAVKVMHGFLAEQPEAKERFHREAVAVARLKHPHIIEIFDYSGEDQDTSYIVAELVEGQPLSKWLDGVEVAPPEAALLLARPIADALVHAHESGVIHRDLKPENVLVGAGGEMKLTDFGIARMLDNQTMTITGTLLGSPAYMPPEYIEGQPTDERADIFSFGAMLYQFVTGSLPFSAPSPHALLKRIASGQYDPANQLNPRVHSGLSRLIDRCLEREPDDRFPSARAMLDGIDSYLADLDVDPLAGRKRLLSERDVYCDELQSKLEPTYTRLGKRALTKKRTARALDHFDRVLSINPQNQEVRRLIDRLGRRRTAARGVALASIGVAGALMLSTGVTLWMGRDVAFAPTPAPPDEPLATLPAASETPDPRDRDQPFQIRGGPAVMFVDGVRITGPLRDGTFDGSFTLAMQPGLHSVRIEGKDRQETVEVSVPMEGALRLEPVDLRVRPPPSNTTTTTATTAETTNIPEVDPSIVRDVEFTCPYIVEVFVDGSKRPAVATQGNRETTFVGNGPFTLPLNHGEHSLRFVSQFHKPLQMTLAVGEEEPPGVVAVQLAFKDAQLKLEGVPEGLMVEVNVEGSQPRFVSERNREDPLLVPLPDGPETKKVRVSAQGYAPFQKRVKFNPGARNNLLVQMRSL